MRTRRHRAVVPRKARLLGLACGLLLFGAACGDDASEETPRTERSGDGVEEPPEDPLYDAEGNLRESDLVLAGLTMPVGLTEFRVTEREHIYTTEVPLQKVQAYFGPRLMTGAVDRMGDGAVFREATPIGATGGVVKLDVSIIPISPERTRVGVREIPTAPQEPLPEAEILRRAQEDPRRME